MQLWNQALCHVRIQAAKFGFTYFLIEIFINSRSHLSGTPTVTYWSHNGERDDAVFDTSTHNTL
jgi:hypothetical protein